MLKNQSRRKKKNPPSRELTLDFKDAKLKICLSFKKKKEGTCSKKGLSQKGKEFSKMKKTFKEKKDVRKSASKFAKWLYSSEALPFGEAKAIKGSNRSKKRKNPLKKRSRSQKELCQIKLATKLNFQGSELKEIFNSKKGLGRKMARSNSMIKFPKEKTPRPLFFGGSPKKSSRIVKQGSKKDQILIRGRRKSMEDLSKIQERLDRSWLRVQNLERAEELQKDFKKLTQSNQNLMKALKLHLNEMKGTKRNRMHTPPPKSDLSRGSIKEYSIFMDKVAGQNYTMNASQLKYLPRPREVRHRRAHTSIQALTQFSKTLKKPYEHTKLEGVEYHQQNKENERLKILIGYDNHNYPRNKGPNTDKMIQSLIKNKLSLYTSQIDDRSTQNYSKNNLNMPIPAYQKNQSKNGSYLLDDSSENQNLHINNVKGIGKDRKLTMSTQRIDRGPHLGMMGSSMHQKSYKKENCYYFNNRNGNHHRFNDDANNDTLSSYRGSSMQCFQNQNFNPHSQMMQHYQTLIQSKNNSQQQQQKKQKCSYYNYQNGEQTKRGIPGVRARHSSQDFNQKENIGRCPNVRFESFNQDLIFSKNETNKDQSDSLQQRNRSKKRYNLNHRKIPLSQRPSTSQNRFKYVPSSQQGTLKPENNSNLDYSPSTIMRTFKETLECEAVSQELDKQVKQLEADILKSSAKKTQSRSRGRQSQDFSFQADLAMITSPQVNIFHQ